MFYTFSQNNSGGGFVVNDNVAEYVIIEADSCEEADDKAEEIGIYFNGCDDGQDCSCCGDRWYSQSVFSEATKKPEIYGEPVGDFVNGKNMSSLRNRIIVYRKNGKKRIYDKKKKKLARSASG